MISVDAIAVEFKWDTLLVMVFFLINENDK